ncbi:MAG: hypothetical protein RR216_01745 [Pseudoflavonifractor sp.]
MRRAWLCAPMILLCVLLTACGQGEAGGRAAEKLALEIRTEYLAMTGCTAELNMTADYGERVYDYGMKLVWVKETGTLLTLVSPEDVAGVAIHIKAGQTVLEYDGARIETGPLSPGGLSPIDAVPMLLTYIREGFIAACTMERTDERDLLRMDCRDPEADGGTGTEVSLWFDAGNHGLVKGEISVDGFTVICCNVTSFQMA